MQLEDVNAKYTMLDALTLDSIHSSPLPISELLENSIYYPSSHFDGSVVKAYAKAYQSFVYCDYGVTEAKFIAEMENFRGYKVLAHRTVLNEELIPQGWKPYLPANLLTKYGKLANWDVIKPPFAYWVVYERKSEFNAKHGPIRFSLLYIGGEGVATYQALYSGNFTTAKAVAIVRPGTGSGYNWTNFFSDEEALAHVVTQNPYGQPDFIITHSLGLLKWNNYPNHRVSGQISQSFYEYPRSKLSIGKSA